jgi:hypothetical protein
MDNSAAVSPSKEQSNVYFDIIFVSSFYYDVPISRDWIMMVPVGVKL